MTVFQHPVSASNRPEHALRLAIADPVIGIGYVIVDVVATGVLPYYMEVISNQRQYMMESCRLLSEQVAGGCH